MFDFLTALAQDESGQDVAEYVMLIALIAVAVVAAVTAFAGDISGALNDAAGDLFPGQ